MSKNQLTKYYAELKEEYSVPNLINEGKKVIFILESPHIDELINNAPVSGLSGKAMSKVVFGTEEKTALGIRLKKETESTIGVMNICSIPMQRAAYIHRDVISHYGEFDHEKYKMFFDVMEKLRTGTIENYKEEAKQHVQDLVLSDFRKKLSALEKANVTLIPCGKVAEIFFKVANIHSDNWSIKYGVPHPSFGNWHKEKYKATIQDLKILLSTIQK